MSYRGFKQTVFSILERKDYIRLYRGLETPFDLKYDTAKTDAPYGYSTWTDSIELARAYASDDSKEGYVYYIDLPLSQMGGEPIDQDGERYLFYMNDKSASIKGKKGNEYLVYTYHDLYDSSMIKLVSSQ